MPALPGKCTGGPLAFTAIPMPDDLEVGARHLGPLLRGQTQGDQNQHVSRPAFNDLGLFEIGMQVCINRKLDNDALAADTKMMTGSEVFASCAPEVGA